MKGKIRVFARVRPINDKDSKGLRNVVKIPDEMSIQIETRQGQREYHFDNVFGAEST